MYSTVSRRLSLTKFPRKSLIPATKNVRFARSIKKALAAGSSKPHPPPTNSASLPVLPQAPSLVAVIHETSRQICHIIYIFQYCTLYCKNVLHLSRLLVVSCLFEEQSKVTILKVKWTTKEASQTSTVAVGIFKIN